MSNLQLINLMKLNADYFEKEEIIEIIELLSQVYIQDNPFIDEEDLAEETLNNLVASLANYDQDFVRKAKKKISELIP